jgi:hypothetical protein
MKVSFEKHKLSICVLRIDRGDYTFPPGVPIVEGRTERARELVVRIEIPNGAEATVAVAWAPSISKCLGLESAAS